MEFTEFLNTYHLPLSSQQAAAVQATEGPVLVLAVPGSGKTTVLVSRVGYLRLCRDVPAAQILTMTYTVAAAWDMRARFAAFFGLEAAEGLAFRTINGVCSRIILYYQRVMGRRSFDLLDTPAQQAAILSELFRAQTGEYATESTVKSLQTAITYVKNQMLEPADLEPMQVEGVKFAPFFRAYTQTLRYRRLMDYDDQLVYAHQILRRCPQILDAFRRQYRYLLVDEAQDTSRIQHAILRLLAGDRANLFLVGDEDQSIYGFRAACPQTLTRFDAIYPGAQIFYLEDNYRSTREILSLADRFIRKNRTRRPKTLRPTRGSGPQPREIWVRDRLAQFHYLAKLAQSCEQETAILYRDNESAIPLIDQMDRLGIPYRCRQMDGSFFSSRVVRDITDFLRLSLDPADGDRFLNLYYKMNAGITRQAAQLAAAECRRTGQPVLDLLADLPALPGYARGRVRALATHFRNMRGDAADRAVYRIVHFMGYGDYLERSGLDANKAAILEILGAAQPTILRLLARLAELEALARAGGSDEAPVVLSTIHSSKDLEYDRVILMDVADGIFPRDTGRRAASLGADDPEEERRLFYVAMTRAREELYVVRFRDAKLPSSFARELFPPAP